MNGLRGPKTVALDRGQDAERNTDQQCKCKCCGTKHDRVRYTRPENFRDWLALECRFPEIALNNVGHIEQVLPEDRLVQTQLLTQFIPLRPGGILGNQQRARVALNP